MSANSRLRADAEAAGARAGLPVFVPTLALSTDNAAMIAAAGLRRYHAGVRADERLNAEASLALGRARSQKPEAQKTEQDGSTDGAVAVPAGFWLLTIVSEPFWTSCFRPA